MRVAHVLRLRRRPSRPLHVRLCVCVCVCVCVCMCVCVCVCVCVCLSGLELLVYGA
jgi:hypothetical protein